MVEKCKISNYPYQLKNCNLTILFPYELWDTEKITHKKALKFPIFGFVDNTHQ
jgi:hypothetical protein